MSQEEIIQRDLISRFASLEGNIRIARARRIFLKTNVETFAALFDFAVKGLKFSHLCTITGLDDRDRLSFIYHLSQDSGIMLNIETSVPKEKPVLKSVTPYFSSAEVYERELVDLLGAQVEGLPEGSNRYPLTDDWPKDQYPLRKDWKPAATETEKEDHSHA